MTGLLLILSCSHFDTVKDQWTWLVMPGYGCHVSGARELGVYTVTASADGHADTTAAVTVEDGGGGCPAYQIFTMVLIPD